MIESFLGGEGVWNKGKPAVFIKQFIGLLSIGVGSNACEVKF